MSRFWGNIVSFIMLAVVIYIFRAPLSVMYYQLRNKYLPCRYPVTYNIHQFDTRFGISEADFKLALSEAEAIWEKPLGKNLFQYDPEGYLDVNLVYDARQASTQQLENTGQQISNTKETYLELKARYDALKTSYQKEKTSFDAKVVAFNAEKAAYEAEVQRVNSHGGADKATYSKMQKEKAALDQEISAIQSMQNDLNGKISQLNQLSAQINATAKDINSNVSTYNTIGSSLGAEFDEGLYKSDIQGQEVDIYQFDNQAKLVRVLAHELGHALGLEHVDDPKAIMYYLNSGQNEKTTAADISELKTYCGFK